VGDCGVSPHLAVAGCPLSSAPWTVLTHRRISEPAQLGTQAGPVFLSSGDRCPEWFGRLLLPATEGALSQTSFVIYYSDLSSLDAGPLGGVYR
jgi:hypothetical protein